MTNLILPLCQTLAWPISAIAITLLFRREVRMAMGRLGQLRYQGLEISFREDLRQAETLASMGTSINANAGLHSKSPSTQFGTLEIDPSQDVATSQMPLISPMSPLESSEQRSSTHPTLPSAEGSGRSSEEESRIQLSLDRMSRKEPRRACLTAWANLTRTIHETAARCGNRRDGQISVEIDAKFLKDRGWLSTSDGRLMEQLIGLAEQVEEGDRGMPSPANARRFIGLITGMIKKMSAIS